VPIVPFLLMPPQAGVIVAVAVTGAALFFAGVLSAISTMAPLARSGLEMLFVGLGSAAATYLVGAAVGTTIG
jgi:VIT1/CCC1 family predicted Fe2+/Mn2+ transporter